jgi:hypothetical protein
VLKWPSREERLDGGESELESIIESIATITIFLAGIFLGIIGGYAWRDRISRARRDRSRKAHRRLGVIEPQLLDRPIELTPSRPAPQD